MSQVYILGVLIFYISAGVYTQVENRAFLVTTAYEYDIPVGEDALTYLPAGLVLPLSFHISCYFVGVTLLTVGYGDITPTCQEGQVIVVGFLIISIVLVPRQMSELLRLMEMQSRYRRLQYKS